MDQPERHWIAGLVVPGDGRGRTLGFPTANLWLDHEIEKPEDGIYAAWATIEHDTRLFRAVVHVGPRPTIAGVEDTIEVHLLESDYIDLYGKKLLFSPVKKLRKVEKFESLDELSDAIADDCRIALKLLVEAPKFL